MTGSIMWFSRRLTDVKELGTQFKFSLREFPSYVIIATVSLTMIV
jgi:hypothetical protein